MTSDPTAIQLTTLARSADRVARARAYAQRLATHDAEVRVRLAERQISSTTDAGPLRGELIEVERQHARAVVILADVEAEHARHEADLAAMLGSDGEARAKLKDAQAVRKAAHANADAARDILDRAMAHTEAVGAKLAVALDQERRHDEAAADRLRAALMDGSAPEPAAEALVRTSAALEDDLRVARATAERLKGEHDARLSALAQADLAVRAAVDGVLLIEAEGVAWELAEANGIDRNQAQTIMDPRFRGLMGEYAATQKKIGANDDDAAQSGTAFEQSMRRLEKVIGDISIKVETSLFKKLQPQLDDLAKWATENGGKIADDLTTIAEKFIAWAAAIGKWLTSVDWKAVFDTLDRMFKSFDDIAKKLTGQDGLTVAFAALGAVLATKVLGPLAKIVQLMGSLIGFMGSPVVAALLGIPAAGAAAGAMNAAHADDFGREAGTWAGNPNAPDGGAFLRHRKAHTPPTLAGRAWNWVKGKLGVGGAEAAPGRGGSFKPANLAGTDPEIVDYIRKAAIARGINPDVALSVADSEGLHQYVGDKGTSYGPYQLHYGGSGIRGLNGSGLGDDFTRATGKHARDASTTRDQIDFALDHVKKHGWGAFHGARKNGIGNWQGIGNASASAGAPDGMIAGDISGQANYSHGQLDSVKGLIFHHTGGIGTPEGVVQTLNQRGLGVQYVMGRDGKIYRTLPNGARGAHILRSEINDLNNSNSLGMEVIARNNADVTPAQIAAGKAFAEQMAKQYPGLQVFGHGEVNPHHKQADEGAAIVQAYRAIAGQPTLDPNYKAPAIPIGRRALQAYMGRDQGAPTLFDPHKTKVWAAFNAANKQGGAKNDALFPPTLEVPKLAHPAGHPTTSINNSRTRGDVSLNQTFNVHGTGTIQDSMHAAKLTASRGAQDLLRNMAGAET